MQKKWIELLSIVGEHKAGEFLEVDEAVALSYIAAGLARDGGHGPEVIILERAVTSLRGELGGMVADIADTIRQAAEQASAARGSVHFQTISGGESQADRTMSYGDFIIQAVAAQHLSYSPEQRASAHERLTKVYKTDRDNLSTSGGQSRAMVEGSGTAGGYLTPVIYETSMFEAMWEEEVFANVCQNVPMGARDVEWPALSQYFAPAANQTAQSGGVYTYYRGETIARTEADPTFRKVKLVAQDLTAYIQFSCDLMQDAPALSGMLPRLVGGALGWREDWEFINGLGNGRPLGYLNSPALISIARSSVTAGDITYTDLATMVTRVLPSMIGKARWLIHPFQMKQIYTLKDDAGRLIYQPNFPGSTGGPATAMVSPGRIFEIPIYKSEKMPAPGVKGDLSLVVPSAYLKGTRAGIEIGLSDQYAFPQDEIALRAKLRHDGQPWLKAPIILADGVGTNTVSGFVALDVH